jgi:hypothetical protein
VRAPTSLSDNHQHILLYSGRKADSRRIRIEQAMQLGSIFQSANHLRCMGLTCQMDTLHIHHINHWSQTMTFCS